MKKFVWRKCRKIFLKAFFPIRETSPHKSFVIILRDIIGLEKFIFSFSNLQLRCVTCTGVTLKLHCSQPIRNEYFLCILLTIVQYYQHRLTIVELRKVNWSTSVGQRENVSPRHESKPWPPENTEGALSTEAATRTHAEQGPFTLSYVTGVLRSARISTESSWVVKSQVLSHEQKAEILWDSMMDDWR